jgi:hypothetical protein
MSPLLMICGNCQVDWKSMFAGQSDLFLGVFQDAECVFVQRVQPEHMEKAEGQRERIT